jgi:hypothetical protein
VLTAADASYARHSAENGPPPSRSTSDAGADASHASRCVGSPSSTGLTGLATAAGGSPRSPGRASSSAGRTSSSPGRVSNGSPELVDAGQPGESPKEKKRRLDTIRKQKSRANRSDWKKQLDRTIGSRTRNIRRACERGKPSDPEDVRQLAIARAELAKLQKAERKVGLYEKRISPALLMGKPPDPEDVRLLGIAKAELKELQKGGAPDEATVSQQPLAPHEDQRQTPPQPLEQQFPSLPGLLIYVPPQSEAWSAEMISLATRQHQ